jgi:signal transduction histidine kinase
LAVNDVISLRWKLSLSYVLVAISVVCLVSLAANFLLERQFRDYVKERQEERNRQTVALLARQYQAPGVWKETTVQAIGINALEQGMIVKVRDAGGEVIWDATRHNNGLCQQMLSHMARNMSSRYPNWNGGYTVARYSAKNQFQTVGSVEIGYYGPFFYTDTDLAFINTLNRILLGVTVCTLLVALVVGVAMARSVSAPISRVIETTGRIAEGRYEQRVEHRTDIKELHQLTGAINGLADSLQKQELLRKRLSADVAHELRTPLATVQSHLEAMIDGIWAADPSRLKSCHEEILRLSRMVQDLHKLSKYEGEDLKLERTRFDLGELARAIVLNFEHEFKNKSVALELRTGPIPAPVLADRDKLSQVLVNLLANALKFTPAGGRVEMVIAPQQRGVQMVLRDTGIGIAAADLPNIFERFYRADPSRNRLSGGSGIGLAIVKAIVDAHQGTVTVESQPGRGSTFTVFIPAAPSPQDRE